MTMWQWKANQRFELFDHAMLAVIAPLFQSLPRTICLWSGRSLRGLSNQIPSRSEHFPMKHHALLNFCFSVNLSISWCHWKCGATQDQMLGICDSDMQSNEIPDAMVPAWITYTKLLQSSKNLSLRWPLSSDYMHIGPIRSRQWPEQRMPRLVLLVMIVTRLPPYLTNIPLNWCGCSGQLIYKRLSSRSLHM